MRVSRTTSKGIRVDALSWPELALVDELLASYVDWREGADAVTDSYGWWRAAPAAEKDLRFAAYTAALDQEESAAHGYAEWVGRLERRLPSR